MKSEETLKIYYSGNKEEMRNEIIKLVEFFKNETAVKYTIRKGKNGNKSKLKYKK